MSNKYIHANKLRLQSLIDVIKDVHYTMTKKEYKSTLYHILRELYKLQKNTSRSSIEKEYTVGLITAMYVYVHQSCNATKQQIYATWMKVALENQMTLNYFDMKVLEHLKDFFFGYLQTYQIIFEQKDKLSLKGRYYYVFKFAFAEEEGVENIQMYVSIQDLRNVNQTYATHSIGLDMIPGSYLNDQGYIVFNVSDTTLAGLAHFTFSCYNNCGFTGGFELFPILTVNVSLQSMITKYANNQLLDCNKPQEFFNDYLITHQYNKKIFDVFCPF